MQFVCVAADKLQLLADWSERIYHNFHRHPAYENGLSGGCIVVLFHKKASVQSECAGFLLFLVGVNKLGWQFEYTDTVPVAYSIASQRHPRQEYAH